MPSNLAYSVMVLGAIACVASCHGPSGTSTSDVGPWIATTSIPGPRFEAKALALDGKVYFLGGISGTVGDQLSARESALVDVYDPSTRSWSSAPPLPDASAKHHLAVAVANDKIYVLGGFTGIIGGADAAGVFTPNATSWVLDGGAWRQLADQPVARGSATAETIGGIIYVAGGGVTEPDARTDLYSYDPSTDRWTAKPPLPTAREHVASCVLADKMLVLGGWTGADKRVLGAAELFDPSTGSWTKLPDMSTPRGGLGAAVLDGKCYAVGGEQWTGDLPGTFPTVEVFDPSLGAWATAAPMTHARHGLGVTSAGGLIYAIGGGPIRGNSYTDVVEVFHP